MATPQLSPAKSSKNKIKPPRKKKKKKVHQRSTSEGPGIKKYKDFKVPRKLGPIDMGRIKYKGTKYIDKDQHDFLAEKIHPHARSSSFHQRKKQNPIEKKPTLSEIGTPNSWKKPSFYAAESERMKRNTSRLDFLIDNKPLHTRDKSLDKLKHTSVPKGHFSVDAQAPFSWKPIEYELQIDSNHYLNEKYWFESSKINTDIFADNLSSLLQTLPPEKLLLIQDTAPPTGYQSKLNYLNKLKQIILEEATNNKNTYALNLLNVSYASLSSLSVLSDHEIEISMDNENEYNNNNNNNNNSMFNVTLDALNDGSETESENENEIENENESNESNESIVLNNESDDETAIDIDIDHENSTAFQFLTNDFDEQMSDALEEILAPSPSPQGHYNDTLLDRQMEDALTEILAPSPSPQPQPQPMQVDIENISNNMNNMNNSNHKRVNRRELLKTVQMNLNDIQNKNKTCTLSPIAVECEEDKKDDNICTYTAPITTLTAQMIDNTLKCDELKEDISEIGKHNNSNNSNKNHQFKNKIPSNFICPISKGIMNEAVMASDGRIYDKINIENWLRHNDTSPISHKKLRHKNLMPFNELTNKINCWKIKNISKKKRRKKKRKSLKQKKSNDVIIALSPLSASPLSPLSPLSVADENECNDLKMINLNNINENYEIDIENEKKAVEIGIDSSDTS